MRYVQSPFCFLFPQTDTEVMITLKSSVWTFDLYDIKMGPLSDRFPLSLLYHSSHLVYYLISFLFCRLTGLSYGDENFFTITDAIMGFTPIIRIFKLAHDSRDRTAKFFSLFREQNSLLFFLEKKYDSALISVKTKSQVLSAIWGHKNETIITGHQDGHVRVFDVETGYDLLLHPLHVI